MQRTVLSVFLGAAALGIAAVSPAAAQKAERPVVKFVPSSQAPRLPAGLNTGCVKISNNGAAPSDTCPVVQYQGLTTWAASYNDNRVSFALLSYDERGNLVRNVEKPGARYLFDILPSDKTQSVIFVGQALQTVTVPWSAVGR